MGFLNDLLISEQGVEGYLNESKYVVSAKVLRGNRILSNDFCDELLHCGQVFRSFLGKTKLDYMIIVLQKTNLIVVSR